MADEITEHDYEIAAALVADQGAVIDDHTETLAWLRDLRVTLHGDRATAGITPAALRTVLGQRGWKVTSGNEIREWRRKEGARHRHGEEVFVPLDASYVDYNRRVRDLVSDVAEAEGCGVLGLLLDLRAASKGASGA